MISAPRVLRVHSPCPQSITNTYCLWKGKFPEQW